MTHRVERHRFASLDLLGDGAVEPAADLSVPSLMFKALRLQGIAVGSRADFKQMTRAICAHTLRPSIDRVSIWPLKARSIYQAP